MEAETTKVCCRCKEEKPVSEFYSATSSTDGLRSDCKDCFKAYQSERRRKLSGAPTVQAKCCGDCGELLEADKFSGNPLSPDKLDTYCRTCRAIRKRAYKYNLTMEEVHLFLQIPECQNPNCRHVFADEKEMHFDHCHDGEHFRGVLCRQCNTAASGSVEQCRDRMLGLVEYLERDMERV